MPALATPPANASSILPEEQASKTPSLQHDRPMVTHDVVAYLREYARERPDVAAAWCLGIGFVLGWKLKPW